MTKAYESVRRGFFLALVVAVVLGWSSGLVAARAAPLMWQEHGDGAKVVKRIRVGRAPCVIVSARKQRGMLGVQLTPLTKELRAHFGAPADAGIMVASVSTDGPAEKAGVRVGDIITAIDGEEVSTFSDVARRVRAKHEGEVVELEVYRDRAPHKLTATIEEQERAEVDLHRFFMDDCDEVQLDIDFDKQAVREAIENATEHLRSPEWKQRLKQLEQLELEHWSEALGEDFEEKLEEKLEELEKKLKKMEKELKEIEKKKNPSSGSL